MSQKISRVNLLWMRTDVTIDVASVTEGADSPAMAKTSHPADAATIYRADAEGIEELEGDDVTVPPTDGYVLQPHGRAASASAIPLVRDIGP